MPIPAVARAALVALFSLIALGSAQAMPRPVAVTPHAAPIVEPRYTEAQHLYGHRGYHHGYRGYRPGFQGYHHGYRGYHPGFRGGHRYGLRGYHRPHHRYHHRQHRAYRHYL